MGIKGLHQYLRTSNSLQQGVNVPQQLGENNTNTIFVDFCCEFFQLFQITSALELFRLQLRGANTENNVNTFYLVLGEFVAVVLERLHHLLNQVPGLTTICLVIDGDPLYAKKETHKARKLRRQDAIKLARRRFPGNPNNIPDPQLSKYAKQWLTFTTAMKNFIVQDLVFRGHHHYDENDPNQQGIVYVSAPFEADPVVVHLSNNRPNSAIISRDGDLFAYYGAVDVPRIVKFNWDIGAQFGQGDMTTKRQLLNTLAGHDIADEQELVMAQIEFAVHAAASGNDYAHNIPQISFNKIHESLQALRPHAGNANNVLQRLIDALGNRVTPFFVQSFQVALSQYAYPIVGANGQRSEAMPFEIIGNVLQYTGAEPAYPTTGPQPQGSRYTFLPPDGSYFQEQWGHTSPENVDPLRPGPPPRLVSRAKKAKRNISSKVKKIRAFVDNQEFRHPDGESSTTYSQKSRYKVTCQAGLYSSVLAIDKRNAIQATIITNAMRTLVNKMSFARFACLHIADIAMRQAFTTLNPQQRYVFYSRFFDEDTEIREETWRRLVYCAMNYQPGSTITTYEDRGAAIVATVSDRVNDIVDVNGNIHNGNHHLFKAYEGDVAYIYLYHLMQDEPVTCHIFLKARKIWYSGEFGMLHGLVPASLYMGTMVTEIVHELDLSFRQNVVKNFRARYCDYLRRRLQETAQCPQGWDNNEDFRNTIIQAVQAQTRQQAINTVQQDQNIAPGIRPAVNNFVQRMHSKYHMNLQGFDHNVCIQELINEATVPLQWPANRDRLVRYIFQQIWNVPLYSGEDNRDIDEQADNQQAYQDIQNLPPGIQDAITDFINGERDLQVIDIPVQQYDLRACLGIEPPGEPQVINEPNPVELGTVRPRNGNGNGNGNHNANPDDNANYLGNADDDEFEEDDLEDEYYGRPLKGLATRLVPLMVYMLQHCNGYLTFPLTPHQPWGPIAIPFNHSGVKEMFFTGNHFKHLVTPQISDMQQRIIDAIQGGHMEIADQLEQELDTMNAEIKKFIDLPYRVNRFNQLFDIKRCATIINGEKQVTNRGYLRWLGSYIPGTSTKRFTPRRLIRTDGMRIYVIYADWLRGKREGVQARFMTESRRTTREAMIPLLSPANEGMRQGVDLSDSYRGVVGMDFGEVCPVASVYRPTVSTLQGSQLVIKRGFLYGRTFLNRDQYNNMKAANGIDQLLSELGTSTYQGTYEQLMQYLDLIKGNTRAYRLWMFQSKASVMRFKWDNFMSLRSRLDQACSLVINQASATNDDDDDDRPLIFGFGLDGISQRNRRGAVAPMDQKLINALFHKIKQTNRLKDREDRDICTRVDEYMTSQTCCRCIKESVISQVNYLVRQATIFDRMAQNAQGQVEVLRVVRCQHNDQHTYHRDGNAAENMATILRYMIRFQQRPLRFIRQSRLPQEQQ